MKLKNFTDLNAWAVEQWGDAELGDTRRTQRAIAIGAAIAANPQGSLPDMMQGWNEIRAAYRLFAEDDVTHKALIQPHITQTKQSATEIKSNVILFIQDTTELDYTHHRLVLGLGHIGDGKGRGMMLHTSFSSITDTSESTNFGIGRTNTLAA
ncbi:IS4/Tn5 family transposase DNA-binding protein [Nostoc sp.]|uniref:IS4/Tn5 family transposase DNA-binding protein n=1 Tax=Nostoc sp. TaxID=1180 RepID=UPI002FF98168